MWPRNISASPGRYGRFTVGVGSRRSVEVGREKRLRRREHPGALVFHADRVISASQYEPLVRFAYRGQAGKTIGPKLS